MNAPSPSSPLAVERDGRGKIWSYVRHKWLVETPEESVRQRYLCTLVNEYGYSMEQIDEEAEVTGRGSGNARADFLVWRSVQEKGANRSPLLVVECKAENVTIRSEDYWQGDNYARYSGAQFVITHNERETRYWRVAHGMMPKSLEEIEGVPHADASDKEIEELVKRLKVFKEDEFAALLHKCHNVIRDQEMKDPIAAFDEIAKILFVKVWVERDLRAKRCRENIFTVGVLDSQIGDNPLDALFQQTKNHFKADQIFGEDDRINLKHETAREIVGLLERYNLSDTKEDVKGIAFERFLGRTFRGEIGQFFTPRTIVEFMVHMIDPDKEETICDPASGSGGFLIRFFEIVREKILAEVDESYREFREQVEADGTYSDDEKARLLRERYEKLQKTVTLDLGAGEESLLWQLANRCIFGTDANDRMARTSKMNMIMHGDGHGGVHHHNGFLNVNGVFEGRFDIVLTNPPFGASVSPQSLVSESDLGSVSPEAEQRYRTAYGDLYEESQARVKAALGKPIASLFDLPKSPKGKVKTEVLFVERCLALLKPGGRLGIVLPEGIFNNPTLAYVREFCEDRAYVRAVVSLPQETFKGSGADVKASLLFLQKFTEEEASRYQTLKQQSEAEVRAEYEPEVEAQQERLKGEMEDAKEAKDTARRNAAKKELKTYLSDVEAQMKIEARARLKGRFSYPIFLYEADRVGITATGAPDQNELYPNENIPKGVEKTCLEIYREFRENPEAFLLDKGGRHSTSAKSASVGESEEKAS